MKKLLGLFVTVLLIFMVVPSVHAGFAIFQITDTNDDIYNGPPSLYNGTIAWKAQDHNTLWYGEIFYWDGTTITNVSNNDDYPDGGPSLYDGTIAWAGMTGLFYWDGTNTTEVPNTTNIDLACPEPVSLYNGTVAWVGRVGNDHDIYYWDGTNSTKVTSESLPWVDSLSLFDGTIAWTPGGLYAYIFLWDGTETIKRWNTNGAQHAVSLSNTGFAHEYHHQYTDKSVIYYWAYPITYPTFTYESEYDNKAPSLYEGTIAWQSWDGHDWEIFYWDGTNVMQVTDNDVDDTAPSLYNGSIAWQSRNGADYEIFYAVRDDTEPDTGITDGPTGTVIDNDVTFTYTGTDNVSPAANLTYSYRLEGSEDTWSEYATATVKSYTDLPNGTYTFFVRTKDQAGNVDSVPASRSFTVNVTVPDSTEPDTEITGGPTETVTDNDVTFTYTGTDNESPTENLTYSYRLEGSEDTWSEYATATAKSYTDLPNGTYTFFVRAKDQAANVDSVPASRSFTVNVIPPDRDGDGVPDDEDAFPDDPNEWEDTDHDGIGDNLENGGPNGGDGNHDGTLDSLQANVATILDLNGSYVTLISQAGTVISGATAATNPSNDDSPAGCSFPCGFFGFTITGLNPGHETTLTALLHTKDASLNTYFKYGPIPGSTGDHWYEFIYDGTTGAEITQEENQTRIILYFTDGAAGDDDLLANGEISDVGAPGVRATSSGGSTGSDGGGGCFIDTIQWSTNSR